MLTRLRECFRADFWRNPERHWYGSLGVSALVHICLIALLGCLWVGVPVRSDMANINTRWSNQPSETTDIETIVLSPQADSIVKETGGAPSAALVPFVDTDQPIEVNVPLPLTKPVGVWTNEEIPAGNLSAEVGLLPEAKNHTGSLGNGKGQGKGDGVGGGFFGIQAEGRSFVFVVDCSLSMNHPHASVAKTRFGVVKLELVKSISNMSADQKFYIIFFNGQAYPMPARSLQHARPDLQKLFLEWAVKFPANGQTDPREALLRAIQLKPDVIYFLTDGTFLPHIERDLKKLKQRRVAIHTFAFGNEEAEKLMKRIAAANGGEYHFVP